jgi:hypothetical protein
MRYKEMLIVLLIGVIVFLLFQKRPMYVANRLQTIEHVIEGKDSIVTIWKTKIVQDKGRIEGLTNQVNRYKDSLTFAKELKDTVRIVEYQDTVIKKLDASILFYKSLTNKCDSIITEQIGTIELKDSLIFIHRNELNDIKKTTKQQKKRKKLATILASIGIATLFIVK